MSPAAARRPVPLEDREALLAAAGGDPFVAAETVPGAPVRAWVLGGAVAVVRRSPVTRRDSLAVLAAGPDAAAPAADLAAVLLAGEARDVPAVTLPVAVLPAAAAALATSVPGAVLRGGADWDWLATTSPPPPVPGEDLARPLGGPGGRLAPAEARRLRALLEEASPRRSADPGDPWVRAWWAVPAPGPPQGLLACAAWSEHVPGVPHLEAVATTPGARGRGLGSAVTAAVTRAALASAGRCTLGLYADNAVAARMYHRLGFRTVHRFASRSVLRRAGPRRSVVP